MTIINFIDILSTFRVNLKLWERKVALDEIGMFPALNELLEDNYDMRLDGNVMSLIMVNL